jgi:hypothetical protein
MVVAYASQFRTAEMFVPIIVLVAIGMGLTAVGPCDCDTVAGMSIQEGFLPPRGPIAEAACLFARAEDVRCQTNSQRS